MTIYLYARVSTDDQNVEQQVQALSDAHKFDVAVSEKFSGSSLERPEFTKLRSQLVAGDTVIVYDISRLGRNTAAVLEFVEEAKSKGVAVRIDNLGSVDVCSTAGFMILTVLAGVAQMQREEMLEKQKIGIDRAKAEGKYKGKQQTEETKKKLDEAVGYLSSGLTQEKAAKAAGISRATLARHIRSMKGN